MKKMGFSMKTAWVLLAAFILMGFSACNRSGGDAAVQASAEETALLLKYLEESGNLVNSPAIPSLIEPETVFSNLQGSNYLVIDLRPAEEYNNGHIPNAVNVLPGDILDFFENKIEPNSYERIVLTCPNAMLSGYVNGVLIYLGYKNVSTLRFGLSSWDMDIASEYWLKAISDTLMGKLETSSNPKAAPGSLPALATGQKTGYAILHARAQEILNVSLEDITLSLGEVLGNPGKYYQVNYWPEDLYNAGHLPGGIQYVPKKSLHSNADILTLPVDQPISIDCYTGHHSAFVTPFLRLLGYNAFNLPYGSNSYIHSFMLEDPSPTRSFTEASVRNYPLSSSEPSDPLAPVIPLEVKTTAQGGC